MNGLSTFPCVDDNGEKFSPTVDFLSETGAVAVPPAHISQSPGGISPSDWAIRMRSWSSVIERCFVPQLYARPLGNPIPSPWPATRVAADNDIEAGGNSIPVVPRLWVAAGRDSVTATDRTCDLPGVLSPDRLCLFRGGRNRGHLRRGVHRNGSGKSHRKAGNCNQADHRGLQALPSKLIYCGCVGKLWPPAFKNDLVSPTGGPHAIVIAAHGPSQQRQPAQGTDEQRRRGWQVPHRIGNELRSAPWNMQHPAHASSLGG